MRTRTWLLALTTVLVPAALVVGCGDSGGDTGGAASTGVTASTTGVTVGSSSKSSTKQASVSTSVVSGVTTSGVTTAASTTASTVTASSSSTGSGMSGFAFDSCAALAASPVPVNLPMGGAVSLSDTTLGATDDLMTFCAQDQAGAPDVVYQVVTTSECTFTADLSESSFSATLSLRPTCDARNPGTLCASTGMQQHLGIDLPAGTNYIVVDGNTGADTGDFNLALSCAAPACGDFVVNPGEACDAGPNPAPATGCTGTCQLISSTASDTCPGTPLPVVANTTEIFPVSPAAPYNNTGAIDNYQPSSACDFGGPSGGCAPDQVFQFTATQTGHVSAIVGFDANGTTPACDDPNNATGCWNFGVFIQAATCGNVNGNTNEVGCGVYDNNTAVAEADAVMNAGTTYYIIVKPSDSQCADLAFDQGSYFLKVITSP